MVVYNLLMRGVKGGEGNEVDGLQHVNRFC